MSALLQAEGINVEIGGRPIVRDVALELQRGEVTVLIGPNGAGKTTLLEVLAGLDRPAAGKVVGDGSVAAALQGAALAHRSARQNVELALAWHGVPKKDRRERAANALQQLDAEALADQPARTLSGGEARRVHLARALAVDPDVLLLDEPFAGLDVTTRADLLYATEGVIRSERRATLVVVHERAEAWALADRVIVMIDGRIVASGTPREVFESPATLVIARFVGYVGSIREDGQVLAVRPSDVRLEANGSHHATVRRRIPVDDGVRLELELANGEVVGIAESPGPEIGEEVRFGVRGGVRFPLES